MEFTKMARRDLRRGVDYTTERQSGLIGTRAELGDIVASGIEPGEPVGRIIGFDHTKRGIGSVIVQHWNGEIRQSYLGGGYCGYCKRDAWDGPTPNTAKDLMPGLR